MEVFGGPKNIRIKNIVVQLRMRQSMIHTLLNRKNCTTKKHKRITLYYFSTDPDSIMNDESSPATNIEDSDTFEPNEEATHANQ
jgi:hypothetical protein